MGEKVGRGWGAVAGLALATMVLSAINPALPIFVPLSLMLLALPPRRPALLALGGVLAATVFWGPRNAPLWSVERGWVLMVGAWFILMVLVWPRASFLPRALAALGASVLSAALFLGWSEGSWAYLDWTLARHFRDVAAQVATMLSVAEGANPWLQEFADSAYGIAELQAQLHPALLALASLAGLGVAWWAFHRLAVREPNPLGALREFRFRDDLVWVLISGLLLVVLPLGDGAGRIGVNVLVFMGALYALRGVAVLLAVLELQRVGSFLFAVVAILFPLVMVAALVVGLTDTWLDLRARRAAARSGS